MTLLFNLPPEAYDCPLQDGIFETASLISGASIVAADTLISGQANMAINWYGGWHHAKRLDSFSLIVFHLFYGTSLLVYHRKDEKCLLTICNIWRKTDKGSYHLLEKANFDEFSNYIHIQVLYIKF